MTKKTFNGTIALDIRDSVPDWEPYAEPKAAPDSPNILYIVIDDTGFGAWEMFGGKIRMPNLARIAKRGLVYTNFHTTALCSPTRSSLLNGRNATSNGMSCIEEATTGFPGNNGRIPPENALIGEVLRERGYNTFAVGKWHLLPEEEANLAATKRNWPLARGFDRYYGFLGGETDQWYPDIVYDNHISEPPGKPDMDDPVNGYHLSKDLVDKAIMFIQDSHAIAPAKPWLLYFSPGANHAPHQIWPELILKYEYNSTLSFYDEDETPPSGESSFEESSDFSAGYEAYRGEVFTRMKELGIFDTSATFLPSPVNPHGEGEGAGVIAGVPAGKSWPETDWVRRWSDDALTKRERALFVRMAEIYAAFSTYTDEQIGRLLDYLERSGQMENTIVIAVADNGASAEGGPNGSVNENLFFNGIADDADKNFALLQQLGTERTYNHYPTGWAWAFDTPYPYWKRWSSYEGGTATPMMICTPERFFPQQDPNEDPPYRYRKQYVHAVDVVATLYDMIGVEPPDYVKGYPQNPIEGTSFRYTFDDAFGEQGNERAYAISDADWPVQGGKPKVRESQFYSMLGTRGVWDKGWFACTMHAPTSDWGSFDDDLWELYCLDGDPDFTHTPAGGGATLTGVEADPTQCNNLVAGNPAPEFVKKLQTMINQWFTEAGRLNGMPLDDRAASDILGTERPSITPEPFPNGEPSHKYTYYPGGSEVPEPVAPNVRTRSFEIKASFVAPPRPEPYRRAKGTARSDASTQTIGDPRGVLYAHGGRFGGHGLYLHAEGDETKLCYVYNWLGQREQRASCVLAELAPGPHTVSVKFTRAQPIDPNDAELVREYGNSVAGRVELYIDEQLQESEYELGVDDGGSDPSWNPWTQEDWFVGIDTEMFITQPAKFALCGEGMNIGRDAGQAVSHDYVCPNEIENVLLERVEVTIWNDGSAPDGALDMRGMLWRD
ncbi:MAG: sulfatase-like hydrolase/transferase [Myxococcales bacterium]|nr:sulfatase-like hydrolase/transferase [Myxococcales bacterium]MCB9718557.1 sulfatase-like hydrolase/transferase [Myxococcales bacterium]